MEATDFHTLSFISQINWRPGIGDPTAAGWLTVAAYFTACLLCIACATSRLEDKNPAEKVAGQRKLWWFIVLAMLLLCINKQLDLQTLLTEVGKVLAKRQGWYEQRRSIQALFIAGVGFCGFFSLMLVWRTCRNLWKDHWLTIAGLIFLVSFVVIRAASFHHMDLLLGRYISGFKINWLLEMGGIACILISAVIHLKPKSKRRRQTTTQKDIFL